MTDVQVPTIDPKLLHGCRAKDRKAQSMLYEQYYSFLFGVCLRYTNSRDEAKEMLNIGFMKILTNIKMYKVNVPFDLWARKVMINVIIDQWRKFKKNEYNYIDYQDINSFHSADHHYSLNEGERQLRAEDILVMIKKLPPLSQKVFNLYVMDGFSHGEISKQLNMAEGTSKWHLNFARERLKVLITQAAQIKNTHI